MASKVLPGSKYAAAGTGDSGTGGRQFSVQESATVPGQDASDPYDSPADGSVFVRDALGAGTAPEGKDDGGAESSGKQVQPQASIPERDAGRMPTWEEELEHSTLDIQQAYRLHMKGLAEQFREDLMAKAESEMEMLVAQSEAAYVIERNRKDTIDYAMAAYGEDADLQGISDRAMVAQQVNSKEMTGPFVGLSFGINQKLSGGRDSLVRLPNGQQVEMDSQVAAVLDMPEDRKGSTMAGLFAGYVRENDPGFMAAIESAGGTVGLARNSELQFSRNEEQKLKQLWDKVVEAQKDTMDYEAKPMDQLSPKEYEALGLDPAAARRRRLMEHGDPSAGLDIIYSHEEEYNGRRLPTPIIMGQRGQEKEAGGPQR